MLLHLGPTGRRLATTRLPGQSLVEYALIVGLIAIVAIVGLRAFGTGVNTLFNNLLSQISGAAGGR